MNNMNDTFLTINIGSSAITAVIARPKYDADNNIDILGIGISESKGVNKGLIINIEDASKTIKDAILKAKESVAEAIGTTVVSISGNYTKGIKGSGAVNVPNGLVSEADINQAMQMALSNAIILPEYEVVHVIPQYFRIDEEEVDNPLNMNGNRLEVAVYIVTAKRNALINIKSALKISGIDDVKFALDSYVSSLAVLDEQQRKFGAVVINVGSTTTEFVYFKGNSIVYNGFIPAGSKNITNDLSVMLHTPNLSAEKIKIEYGSLTRDYSANNEVGATKVTLPRTDDEDSYTEVALDYIQTIIHARVEEILVLVKNRLKKSALLDNIGSGIVLTGGMSCLGGIKELTKKIFEGIPVSVSTPKNLPNNFKISFDETNMSTVVGLLMYSLGINRSYQLDSGKKLIRPVRKERVVEKVTIPNMNNTMNTTNREYIQTKQNNGTVLEPLEKDKKKGVSGLWNKLSEWF